MRSLFVLLLFFFFPGCESPHKEPFASMLRTCDGVDIIFYNGGDTLSYETRDTTGVKLFVRLISGSTQPPADTCAPSGELRYKGGNQPLLTAQFATPHSSGKEKCNYVTYLAGQDRYRHSLTPKAYNLIRQIEALPPVKKPEPENGPPAVPDTIGHPEGKK